MEERNSIAVKETAQDSTTHKHHTPILDCD
jgi:hypothetical protein